MIKFQKIGSIVGIVMLKSDVKKRKIFKNILYSLVIMIVMITAIIYKFPKSDYNFMNSDAAWHTLLTIESYNETPIKTHLFLPIVSLGKQIDKNIPWGATVHDQQGNYYYTSFSAAGYFFPWLFMTIFHMPVNLTSLYIFNSMLFVISALLWFNCLLKIYQKSKHQYFLAMIGVLAYIFVPEALHGMGVVYWHQSIMQVTLLIQLLFYLKMQENNNKITKFFFYFMTVLNPYIEWTGFIANIGYAAVEFFRHWKENKKIAFLRAFIIGVLTAFSFIIFSVHYLLKLDCATFLSALKYRFLARNYASTVPLSKYYDSFKYLWFLIAILIGWNLLKNEKIEIKNGFIIFILLFMVLENFIMVQHAATYSYDRLKLIFALSLFICELCRNILENVKYIKFNYCLIFSLTLLICFMNFNKYLKSNYFWNVDFFEDNKIMANYINEKYPEAMIIVPDHFVRGYLNLLFHRGMYERIGLEEAKKIANGRGSNEIVIIDAKIDTNGVDKDSSSEQVYKLLGIQVYNMETKEIEKIKLEDHEILTETLQA